MTRIQIFPCICKGFHFRRRIKLFKNGFRIVDIEINVLSCLFVNLKISLIFSSFPGKFMRVSKVKYIYASYASYAAVYKLVYISYLSLCIYP